jgi:hypothetical protein
MTDDHEIMSQIPDTEALRRRLAVLVTEANVLRAQLRVSVRADQERDRLRRLLEEDR